MLCAAHSRTTPGESCVRRKGMAAKRQAAGRRHTGRTRERRESCELLEPCTQRRRLERRRLERTMVFIAWDGNERSNLSAERSYKYQN